MNILDEIIQDVNLGKIAVNLKNSPNYTNSQIKGLESRQNAKKLSPQDTFQTSQTISLYVYGIEFIPNDETGRKSKNVKKLKRFTFTENSVRGLENCLSYACDRLERYPVVFVSQDENKLTAFKNYRFEYSKVLTDKDLIYQ